MASKKIFESPYIGIDEDVYPILFDVRGNYSTLVEIQNPCMQYAGDADDFYNYLNIFSNLIRSFGAGYAIQKHDVFSKTQWELPYEPDDFLMKQHFSQNDGRVYKHQRTIFIITCELKRSAFFAYDDKKYKDFLNNINKTLSYLNNYDIKASVMNKRAIVNYLHRFFSMDFEDDACSLDNFSVLGDGIQIGSKCLKCFSLVDVELIDMPSFVLPISQELINNRIFPHDLMRFIPHIDADTVIYNQVVFTVNQAVEKQKLEAKIKKHQSVPDPANNLCVEDITVAMDDIERNSQVLVYAHFDILICDSKDLNKARNQTESFLANINIRLSKQSFNQYELFRAAAPGNAFSLKNYDRFLTTADVAVCLMYKECLPVTEQSNLMMWFTDRQGVPVAIDPSDLPMRQNRIDNRNKFVLGPSGSGKSFLMNTMLHQYLLNGSDIVMVDVGHSYKGLCDYFNGRYITYSEDNPISMNPFFIHQIEYNIEKVDFLVNLIILLWKEAHAEVTKIEKDIIRETVMLYYANYFAGMNTFSNELADEYKAKMIEQWNNEDVHDEDAGTIDKLMLKINNFIDEQRKKYTVESEKIIVKELNFNSFYDFAKIRIPKICKDWGLFYENKAGQNNVLSFDLRVFLKILSKFKKGELFGEILNNEIDKTLFDEQFVVFEIDSIQGNDTLFPIVTLVIMDVFIQKMRNKGNRKVIIIEEAWKALASPLMADYIKYLYKTVRKFYGEAITVTQELDDIIKSEVVQQSIISNAATFILCEQTKFKDNFEVVADILSLSEVEQNKIFTINALDNKANRNKFKEFYIKRGNTGEVYGNEVSVYEYFTYTTEKPEKDAMQVYVSVYKEFITALKSFVDDLEVSKVDKSDFCAIINSKTTHYFTTQGISVFREHILQRCAEFRDSGLKIGKFLYAVNNEKINKQKIPLSSAV